MTLSTSWWDPWWSCSFLRCHFTVKAHFHSWDAKALSYFLVLYLHGLSNLSLTAFQFLGLSIKLKLCFMPISTCLRVFNYGTSTQWLPLQLYPIESEKHYRRPTCPWRSLLEIEMIWFKTCLFLCLTTLRIIVMLGILVIDLKLCCWCHH